VIPYVAIGLVVTGTLILLWALVPVRRLISTLPPGRVRSYWRLMAAMILLFLAGYLAYVFAFFDRHSTMVDLIVPVVFFGGSWFVLLSTTLSLQTALDVMKFSTLERDASTDALTGVFNRRYLDRRLTDEIAAARRYDLPLALFMLDVDHFKRVNDTYGHPAGDQILVKLAREVFRHLRETDIFARYGGEEFTIVAPHTVLPDALVLAERIRQSIEQHPFNVPNQNGGVTRIQLTISIGLATLPPGSDDKQALIRIADANLMSAKKAGRNRVMHTPDARAMPGVAHATI